MIRSERISAFVEAIWAWYADNKRDLPWRDMPIQDSNERAYRVLVSEIMLQQTQVSRVKIVFKEFLLCFPRLEDLASASNKDVIMAWRGMGYNSRALRLRDAAKTIVEMSQSRKVEKSVERHGDISTFRPFDNSGTFVFPREMNELLSISGIGPYTAAAIRNFAWNLPTPCIDTNIRRILHRTFYGPENADGTWTVNDRRLLKLADEILGVAVTSSKDRDAANWHAALMDYGSLVQTKNNPKWDRCPLTVQRIMKTTPLRLASETSKRANVHTSKHPEPGRLVGSAFIPNRIFRGKVVEELRDADNGLSLRDLGQRVCIDWSPAAHEDWLKEIVERLCKDEFLTRQGSRYLLRA